MYLFVQPTKKVIYSYIKNKQRLAGPYLLGFLQAGAMEDSLKFGFTVHCLSLLDYQIGMLEIAAITPFESQISALQHLGPRANQTTEAPAVR